MSEAMNRIAQIGILPVIRIDRLEDAAALAEALCAGDIPAIEITMRTECALDAIRRIKTQCPQMTVGAGTVTSPELADRALEAGADFLVSPGLNPETVEHAWSRGAAIVPGCVTATEIEAGMGMGLDTFKFFPAEQMGGLQTIKLLSGPFQKARFIPTGGLNYSLLPQYLALPQVMACGGSFMAPGELIRAGAWDRITELCKKAVKLSLGFALAHVGINHTDSEQAQSSAEWFCRAFLMEKDEHKGAVFAGSMVECLRGKGKGTLGHIAVSTASTYRAMAYLQNKGFQLRQDAAGVDEMGRTKWIYLADEVGGFAVHIQQR